MGTHVVKERIDEGAVGSLSGEPVAAANGCMAEYDLPDGSVSTGPSMLLCLLSGEEDRRVGVGSQLEIGGALWTVATIRLAEEGTGHVELSATVRTPRIPAKPENVITDRVFCAASRIALYAPPAWSRPGRTARRTAGGWQREASLQRAYAASLASSWLS